MRGQFGVPGTSGQRSEVVVDRLIGRQDVDHLTAAQVGREQLRCPLNCQYGEQASPGLPEQDDLALTEALGQELGQLDHIADRPVGGEAGLVQPWIGLTSAALIPADQGDLAEQRFQQHP